MGPLLTTNFIAPSGDEQMEHPTIVPSASGGGPHMGVPFTYPSSFTADMQLFIMVAVQDAMARTQRFTQGHALATNNLVLDSQDIAGDKMA